MLGWAIALPIIGTYIVTSVVLLNFPWLVHRRKQTKFRCRHISHRGGEFSDKCDRRSVGNYADHFGISTLTSTDLINEHVTNLSLCVIILSVYRKEDGQLFYKFYVLHVAKLSLFSSLSFSL